MTASLFLVRPDHELERCPDAMLVDYVRAAHAADQAPAARRALAVFAWRQRAFVHRMISRKAPRHEVDDLVALVLSAAARSSFVPASGAHLRAWLCSIAARRVADYFRHQARRPVTTPLPETGAGPTTDGGIDVHGICVRLEDRRRRARLRPDHRAALLLHCERDLPASEVAGLIPGMTAGNVAQIRSRHRTALTRALDVA